MKQLLLITALTFLSFLNCRYNQNKSSLKDDSVTSKGVDSILFFHWQDEGGNRAILENAGFPLSHESHALDLNHQNNNGWVNEKVINLLEDWYIKNGKKDVAGSGLYISGNLNSSKSYGSDLLVVEVRIDRSIANYDFSKEIAADTRFHSKSDKALEAGTKNKLDPIVKYNAPKEWFVIPRAPLQGEGVEILVRPPSGEDAIKISKEFLGSQSQEKQLKFLAFLAQQISSDGPDNNLFTNASRYLFHRVFFDHGYESLMSLDRLDDIHNNFSKYILPLFIDQLPKDERTIRLGIKEIAFLMMDRSKDRQSTRSYVIKSILNMIKIQEGDFGSLQVIIKELIALTENSAVIPDYSGGLMRALKDVLVDPEQFGISDPRSIFYIQENLNKLHFITETQLGIDGIVKTYWDWNNGYKKYESTFGKAGLHKRLGRGLFTIKTVDRYHVSQDISHEYSRLNRLFMLVDPVLVSEDIHTNNATSPWLRFNETYHFSGGSDTQKTWQNFLLAWQELLATPLVEDANLHMADNRRSFYFDSIKDFTEINKILLAGYVDGAAPGANADWNRDKYNTVFKRSEWEEAFGSDLDKELAFFTPTYVDDEVHLKFNSVDQHITNLDLKILYSNNPQENIINIFLFHIFQEKDPIKRAAAVLYYLPRLHPFEDGNGRLARMLAGIVLTVDGISLPVGLPTNDFLMSQERIELELRKAIKLGEFYESMLQEAYVKKIPVDDFFQKIYKGSALEGLVLMNFDSIDDLRIFLKTIENVDTAPIWGKDYLKFALKTMKTEAGGTPLAELDEYTRDRMLKRSTREFVESANPFGADPIANNVAKKATNEVKIDGKTHPKTCSGAIAGTL